MQELLKALARNGYDLQRWGSSRSSCTTRLRTTALTCSVGVKNSVNPNSVKSGPHRVGLYKTELHNALATFSAWRSQAMSLG
eukprot:360840-Chlamydomonas_euryale.AAC.5